MTITDEVSAPPKLVLHPAPPLATVRIVSDETESGFVIVNESDFDKKTMKLFVEKSKAPDPA
jgi:hypothetical protein